MINTNTAWDRFYFLISGGAGSAEKIPLDILDEEKRIARANTVILLGLILINFLCTALSAYDVFIDLRLQLSASLYLTLVVFPVALVWTTVVFCVLRFLIQISHDVDGSLPERLWHLAKRFPVWGLLPLLGLMASAPIQVRALGDDIQLASVMTGWNRLSADLLKIHLTQARDGAPQHHPCIKPLMTPAVVIDPVGSLVRLADCKDLVETDTQDTSQRDYSRQLLKTIYSEIHDDGLVARVGLAFKSAPGISWLIALVMMGLFSTPVITRVVAHRRAYEYFRDDHARLVLMRHAGIELHAHEAFDRKGKPVPLHRYRCVEAEQRLVQADYEAQAAASRERLEHQREAALRRI